MRTLSLLSLCLALAACQFFEKQPVDPASLPPMSGQERALIISANASASGGDYAAAERNYLTAVAKSQGHVEAHIGLVQVYLATHQEKKAEEMLAKAAELQPNHAEVNRLRGKIAMENDRYGEALQYFEAGLKSAPSNLDLLTGAGIANDLTHRHAAAQVIYLKALQLRPSDDLSMVRTNLAMSYLLDDKAQKAIDLLKAEVKKPGTPAAMRHNLALAYGVLGRHAQAKTVLNGELTEEERLQSIKRLKDHITHDAGKDHPWEHKPDKKPMVVSKPEAQPKVHMKE